MMATESTDSNCAICKFEVSVKSEGLFCNGFCRRWHHIECVNVTSSEFKKIKSVEKKIKWFCEPCEDNLNKVTSKVYSIEDFLNLNSTVNNLASLVNSVIGRTESLNKQFSDIFSEVKKLSNVTDSKQETVQPLRLRRVKKKSTETADFQGAGDQKRDFASAERVNTSEEGSSVVVDGNNDAAEWECQQQQDDELSNVTFASVLRNPRKSNFKPIIGTKKPEQATKDSFLKVVDRKISIFISRLDPDVSKETVEQYLNEANVDNVECEKLKTRYETYSSFKLTLAENSVSKVLDPTFWPEGTLVKRFVTPKKAEGSRPPYKPRPSRVFFYRQSYLPSREQFSSSSYYAAF